MTIQKFHKIVSLEAIRWDGTYATDDELFDWAIDVWGRNEDGSPKMFRNLFLSFLPDNDMTRETFSSSEIADWQEKGFTAVVHNIEHGRWLGVRTGDWVAQTAPEVFEVFAPEDFPPNGYEPAAPEKPLLLADPVCPSCREPVIADRMDTRYGVFHGLCWRAELHTAAAAESKAGEQETEG